jgi:long-chain acyl-CoA synthetase
MEWAITELSCNAYSMVLVPLYDTLGPDAVQLIVEQVCWALR